MLFPFMQNYDIISNYHQFLYPKYHSPHLLHLFSTCCRGDLQHLFLESLEFNITILSAQDLYYNLKTCIFAKKYSAKTCVFTQIYSPKTCNHL